MVLADSHKASPTSRYSGSQPNAFPYVYGTITLCRASSQKLQLRICIIMSVLQPRCCRNNTGLGSYAFARHYLRNHYCFLFLCLLRCFSSAGLRFLHYTFSIVGFPIRISADHVLFANPRSFSQLITSFIASESQGNPRVPFLTFFL